MVAEIGQAHDGSLGTAHAYIDAAARAGADAVKFQTHLAAAESTPREPWRIAFSRQDATRYDYWQRMEFSQEHWSGLRAHAQECNLRFICSPFSVEAVELIEPLRPDAWKVASGEVGNHPMLERMLASGLPLIVSSGMSALCELDQAVSMIQQRERDLTVLQCTSLYPTPPEKLGLNQLDKLRRRYGCKVGLSDHCGTIVSSLAAVALGADLLELHVTFSPEAFGPDVVASVTLSQLRELVQGVRFLERARAHPVDKDQLSEELLGMRQLFTRSVVARVALTRGTVLESAHLALKKPGSGIPPQRLSELLGRRVRRDLEVDELLAEEDLE